MFSLVDLVGLVAVIVARVMLVQIALKARPFEVVPQVRAGFVESTVGEFFSWSSIVFVLVL